MTKLTPLNVEQTDGMGRPHIHLREISGDELTPLETVGQDLRAARLRRGEDVTTAARVLKIRKDHLEALEEDRLAALPGRTYAVGFVRAYSDYLGLDPVETVERFKHEIAGRDDGAAKTSGFVEQQDQRRLPHGWIVIAALVLGLVAYGIYHLAISQSVVREPVAAVPAQMLPKAKLVPTHPVRAAGTNPPSSKTPVQTTAANTPDSEQLPGAPAETGHVYGLQNANAHVVLRVRHPTRILVQDENGKVFINRMLDPGDAYQVPNLPGLQLTAQHGDAVEIDLDGQAMGLASTDSELSEALSLDPQAIADRYSNGRHG